MVEEEAQLPWRVGSLSADVLGQRAQGCQREAGLGPMPEEEGGMVREKEPTGLAKPVEGSLGPVGVRESNDRNRKGARGSRINGVVAEVRR